jgi:hypothetical protein
MFKPVMRAIAILLLMLGVLLAQLGHSRAWPATLTTPDDWSGSWHGTYVCAQGVTGLTLTIKPSGLRSVTAVFSFYPVPRNPTVPSGEFTMTGDLRQRAGHLQLIADTWTKRPPNYVMVGLDGGYDTISGEYRGRVPLQGCGLFHLRRDLIS